MSLTKFRINEPDVVSETIDGETVAVSLSTGTYYSLGGAAPEAWSLIELGCGVEQIVSDLTRKFEGDHDTIAKDTDLLLKQLLAEKLIVAENAATEAAASEPPTAAEASTPLPYEPPILEKFNDMQELLLLDPIHEVDTDAGWPAAKAAEV
ncbi:PqqD family protein [cf. Phormidesmis sp. LEGE 11477]|uniref:PqqD family protein n=1 Tax=cf. Phormidesmis sp. LEGE 11477 TaxID=1828680 RepID=UPI00188290F0|nr:PqqD family protein [cf. Phormidesmis sp. LEGE 11477]MBE9060364.1 PqqD family protein [cf. Phormidesmis sp. LEGE 11477]